MKNIVVCLIEKMEVYMLCLGRATVSGLLTVDGADVSNRELNHGGVPWMSVID